MFLNLGERSRDLVPYLVSWRIKGSYSVYKQKRIWTFSKANAFANRMISRGYHVEIVKQDVTYSDFKREILS